MRSRRRARLVNLIRAFVRRVLILFRPEPSPLDSIFRLLTYYEREIVFGLAIPVHLLTNPPIPRTRIAWRELFIPESR